MDTHKKSVPEKALVELLITINGSYTQSRIATFELPVVVVESGDDETPGTVQFETKALVKAIKRAVDGLV